MFYRVVVLGVRHSITNACTGAYHKDACGVQGNADTQNYAQTYFYKHPLVEVRIACSVPVHNYFKAVILPPQR